MIVITLIINIFVIEFENLTNSEGSIRMQYNVSKKENLNY